MGTRIAPVTAACLCVLALAGATLAPTALASSDGAATSRYVRANYTLVLAAHSRIKQVESTLRGLLGRIRHECPQAAANSPQETQSEQLSNEAVGTLVLTAIHVDLTAGRAYVTAVRGLHWSNASITRSVRAYASKVSRMISLPIPKLCSDVRSWAQSGFTTLPSFTEPFDRSFLGSWVSPGFLPSGLSRFESSGDRGLVHTTERMESDIVELEAREVETWGQIMNAMELLP
jgi:hypothetical protein